MEFKTLPLPWVRADKGLNVVLSNDKFSEEFYDHIEELKLINIKELAADFDPLKGRQLLKIKDKSYIVTASFSGEFYDIVFDRADFVKNAAAEMAVGLIFTDNLADSIENVEEKRRGVIRVIIDNKISDYFQSSGGIVRRFESDKYIFFLSGDLLKKCMGNKFSILEGIKHIDCGDSGGISLSIGVGIGGKTLKESLDFAKTAVDLALSRGGDQAIVKNCDSYEYFGGTKVGGGSNSRVRARAKAYALQDLMTECSDVMVMGHKNVDFDSLGACVGLCKIARTFNRPFKIVLGEVTSAVMPLYNRLKEDKIYKDKFISPEEAENVIKKGTLLIIADCHLASYCENGNLIKKADKFVVFDHHRKVPDAISGYVLSYLEPRASSASELICEMLKYISKNFRLTALEADALLAGIMLDTKYFTVKTGIQTFEAASYLKSQGADTIRVKLMFKENIKSYFDRIEAIRNCKIIEGNMAVAVCGEDCENPVLTAATTADELLKISDIEASFVIAKAEGYINISMRSLGKINVSLIAEKLGGGGHFETAACQLENMSAEEAERLLKEKINEFVKEDK